MITKKSQISLDDAPTIVMIVGFVFLLMATIALVSEEFNDSLPLSTTTVTNETGGSITSTGYELQASGCNAESYSITTARNATDGTTIASGNYTLSGTTITNATDTTYSDVNFDYTYEVAGVACNVTDNLNTELEDNTSIAGVVLTISLVGIILSILIGVFVMARNREL